MIDIHTHLLPYLDDGADDWNIAVQMAQQAIADGIDTIIATPHHANGRYHNPSGDIASTVAELNRRLQLSGLEINVLAGQEVRVYDQLINDLESGQLLTLNHTRYLLLEFPSSTVPKNIDELLFELSLLGVQAIIAHPERNAEIASNPDILRNLVELGALGQITAQSLAGAMGRKLQRLSIQLCRMNLIHLIASDAHDLIRRPFGLSEAYQVIANELGEEYEGYLKDNAKRVVKDMPISPCNVQLKRMSGYKFNKILQLFSH